MAEKMTVIETDLLNEKIQKIIRQTNYTEEIAKENLIKNNYDEIATIKLYFGITERKEKIKSINQEIYKQLRYKLNNVNVNINDVNNVNK